MVKIVGYKPSDELWENMRQIWESCRAIDIKIPEKVVEYFNGKPPDSEGVEIEVNAKEFGSRNGEGYSIDLSNIPEDVDTILVYTTLYDKSDN